MRGQTTLDYAFGMSVFLLIVTFVFVATPTLLDPFTVSSTDDSMAQSERIADVLVTHLATDPGGRTIENARVETFFVSTAPTASELRQFVGLDPGYRINVTVSNSSTRLYATGDTVEERSDPARTTRIVTISNRSCTPTCQLVVRVW
jgi:hypothetical protein